MASLRDYLGIFALLAAIAFYFISWHSPLTGIVPLLHLGIPWGFTEDEMPDLAGKIALVTGANVGLGRGTAQLLAKHNADVHVTCRSQKKCDEAVKEIGAAIPANGSGHVSCSVVELSSLKSVSDFVKVFPKERLDMLILNAGVMACPYKLTDDGIEWQFGVNHLAHFLLTKGLLPLVEIAAKSTGDARVVSVSSLAHVGAPAHGVGLTLDKINDESTYSEFEAYGQSKLANILLAKELQRRMDTKGIPVFANAVHPGGVSGNLVKGTGNYARIAQWFGIRAADSLNDAMLKFYWSEQDGALSSLFLATSPKVRAEGVTGQYFVPIARPMSPSSHGQNSSLAKQLWDFSEALLAQKGF